MLCHAPSCSEACLFFSNDLCLWLHSVQYDLQHDFAWVTDEADRSVVLTLLGMCEYVKAYLNVCVCLHVCCACLLLVCHLPSLGIHGW